LCSSDPELAPAALKQMSTNIPHPEVTAIQPATRRFNNCYRSGNFFLRKRNPNGVQVFSMRRGRLLFRMAAAGIWLCCLQSFAQQPIISAAANGAQGHLTVTATVVSSIGLVMSPEGEQQIVIANAADVRDNVSRLQPVVAVKLAPVADGNKGKSKRRSPGFFSSSMHQQTQNVPSRTELEHPSVVLIPLREGE
jgi:hypothetical protein